MLDSDDDEIAPRNALGPRAGSLTVSTTPTTRGDGGAADQFEQDLALAMRLSMEEAATPSNAIGSGSTSAGPATATAAAPNANSSRAELERARLERQRAREADGTAQPSVINAARPSGSGPTPRSRVATLADLTGGASNLRAGGASSQSKLSQRFWDGAVKRVPNDYDPDDESFSFGDLIGPRHTLETAVVSAFCLDPLWVASHFPEETPLLLVMPRGPGDTLPGFAPFGVKGNTFRAIPPTRLEQGAGVMHTKLMVRSASLGVSLFRHRLMARIPSCSSTFTTTFSESSFRQRTQSRTTGQLSTTLSTSMTSRSSPSTPSSPLLVGKSSAS